MKEPTCKYVFKKGTNIGNICSKQVDKINLCNVHFKQLYSKWLKSGTIEDYDDPLIINYFEKFFQKTIINFESKKNTIMDRIPKHQNLFQKDKNNTFPVDLWKIGKRLGNGGSGVVYECINIQTKKIFAIKISSLNSIYFNNELKIYINYQSNYIPKLILYGTCKQFNYFIIEKLTPIKYLEPENIHRILESLEFFYKNNLSHGDIKIENIMKRDNNELVLIDFGSTKKFYTKLKKTDAIFGTINYMSINGFLGNFLPKNDLESLIYLLLEQNYTLPWIEKDMKSSMSNIISEKLKLLTLIFEREENTIKKYKLQSPYIRIFIESVASLGNDNKGKLPDYNYYKSISKKFYK